MATSTVAPTDTPEARKYNRIRRWMGIGEFALGLAFLLVLLLTGWTGWIRDIAYRSQSYVLAVFLYTLMLVAFSKVVGLGLDYYGFRLEHRYKLSNQKLRGWIWDEVKGLLVSAVIARIAGGIALFHHSAISAALVDAGVAGIFGRGHPDRTARASNFVSDFLQI